MIELKQHLENLEINEEEKEYVSMKEVISRWRKKARMVHPDKVSEENKEEANRNMTNLNKSLEDVLKYVQERENKKSEEDISEDNMDVSEETNEEHIFAKEFFNRFNFPKENSNSFTIHISNSDAESWRDCFVKLYGEPTITNHKVSNKVMDRWWKFVYEEISITLHLYMNNGTANKILVQGGNKFVLVNYVFSQLPENV